MPDALVCYNAVLIAQGANGKFSVLIDVPFKAFAADFGE